MPERRFIGIDPGIVHTGLVAFIADPDQRTIRHETIVVNGMDAQHIAKAFVALDGFDAVPNGVFVEDYRTRGQLRTNKKMIEGIHGLRMHLPPTVQFLDNMGVKQVIKPDLMRVLSLWNFATPTHHQDLRSAARIMLFGMVKNVEFNMLLARILSDHLRGIPW